MSEKEYLPQRRAKHINVVFGIGGLAWGGSAYEKFANGQVVSGVIETILATSFLAEPVIAEWQYRKKLRKYKSPRYEE